jgi:Flp pilus assembly protein TadD
MRWRTLHERSALVVTATLCLFVLVTYVGVVENGDVWDDVTLLTMNPHLAFPDGVIALFSHDMWTASAQGDAGHYYRPLTMLSFSLNRWVAGNTALSYHAGNVLLHVVTGVFALALLRRLPGLTLSGAMAGAFFLALHPMLTEAVAWSSGRFDVQAALLAVAAVASHVRGGTVGRVGTSVAFGLALLSKESAVCVPLLLAAHDVTFRGRPVRAWILGHVGPAIVLVLYFGIRSTVGLAGLSLLSEFGLDLVKGYAFNLLTFLPRLLVPFETTAFRPYDPPSWQATGMVLAAVAAITGLAGWSATQWPSSRSRALVWGWSWFLLTLLPTAVSGPKLEVVGDRYAYLPAVGLAIVVASAVDAGLDLLRCQGCSRVAFALAASVFGLGWLCLAWQSGNRVRDWRSDKTVFEAELRANPSNHVAHRSLGAILAREGRFDDARERLVLAVGFAPSDWRAWNVLCFTELNRNRLADAEAACRNSVRGATLDPSPWVNLASVLARGGRWTETIQVAQRALFLKNDHAEATYLVAVSLANLGRIPEAAQEAHRVLSLQPDHGGARSLLAQIRERGGLESP